MAEWRFSDGTVVTSNGEVTGDSEFAEYCEAQLARVAEGIVVEVAVGPQPATKEPLKLNDDELMAHWLLEALYPFKVRLVTGPLPTQPDVESVPGRIY